MCLCAALNTLPAVLVVEAGPDARGVEPIDVAPDRNNITAEECNWKCASPIPAAAIARSTNTLGLDDALAENGTALSWKIDSGVRVV